MKVLGTNIYGGGFGHGVRNGGANLLGTVETWKPGVILADLLGIKQLDVPVRADMVIMNPPCSRFSSMSTQHYSKEAKHSLNLFCELKSGLDFAKEAGASIIWWENGPIAFTSGRDIIRGAHEFTKAKSTLVLKLDPSYAGLAQLRPRTHVIHFMDDVKLGPLPDRVDINAPVYDWVRNHIKEDTELTPAPDFRYFTNDDPVSVIKAYEGVKCFNSCKPALIRENQRYAYAVLSSRQFAWENHNRWWSVPEYAATMTYPANADYASLNLPIYKMLPLFAKSVMPEVARFVYSKIILPTLAGTVKGSEQAVQESDGLYYARLLAKYKAKDEFSR